MGSSSPAPKTYTPPPLQNDPVSPPIPNFFANRPVGPSPYEAMAQFTPRPMTGPMGQPIAPMQFTPPQMTMPQQPQPQQETPAVIPVPVPVPSGKMTKEEWLKSGRLGKGQR
jgi:hypothetical protein